MLPVFRENQCWGTWAECGSLIFFVGGSVFPTTVAWVYPGIDGYCEMKLGHHQTVQAQGWMWQLLSPWSLIGVTDDSCLLTCPAPLIIHTLLTPVTRMQEDHMTNNYTSLINFLDNKVGLTHTDTTTKSNTKHKAAFCSCITVCQHDGGGGEVNWV